MSKHLLAEAIEAEEFGLKVCRKHAAEFSEPVVYDGKRCPLCQLLREMNIPVCRARRELEYESNLDQAARCVGMPIEIDMQSMQVAPGCGARAWAISQASQRSVRTTTGGVTPRPDEPPFVCEHMLELGD